MYSVYVNVFVQTIITQFPPVPIIFVISIQPYYCVILIVATKIIESIVGSNHFHFNESYREMKGQNAYCLVVEIKTNI